MLNNMDEDQKALAKRLGAEFQRLRQAAGKTQEDVAFESRITTTYISLVERGGTNITITKGVNIARVLGVRLTDVLNVVEERGKLTLNLEQDTN